MKTERKRYTIYQTAIVLTLVMTATASAQISPGKLTTAHEQLEGLSNCTKCHVLGQKVENQKCLACHKEIEDLLNVNEGYHSDTEVRNQNCATCHSEHHGRDFAIIHFDTKTFDHPQTGYPLEGKHTHIDCESCHQLKLIKNAEFERRSGTFLGLQKNCFSCHEDPHEGTLGQSCQTCHDENSFKPASKFDHDKTDFALTGAHLKVECARCHSSEEREGKSFVEYAGIKFADCVPCHRDVHKGRFGEICERCHTTVSFTLISARTFNHDLTEYPLRGAHVTVACKDCHGTDLNSKPKHALCTDCHKDFHRGEFTVNRVVEDCAGCHTVESFKLSTYSIEMHSKITFPLTGAHLATPCETCHFKSSEWRFKNIGIACVDCHRNVHGAELTEKFLPQNECESCHSTDEWSKISFDHDRTGFKLVAKHASTSCRSCHYRKDENGNVVSEFHSLSSKCETCHNDVHFGQFASNTEREAFPYCQSCHTYEDWSPTLFDHEKTKFSLKGAHEKLTCISCHRKVTIDGNSFIEYKLKDFRCAACHSA